MKLLGLECSTARCSLALMNGDDLVREIYWDSAPSGAGARSHHESMIEVIDRARVEAGWRWGEIDCFVAGRGPGNYSGLRAALLTVQALAAPSRAAVQAVSSMEALAFALMQEFELNTTAIIGDARRQSCWLGICNASTIAHAPVKWDTFPREQIEQKLTGHDAVATPHWTETAWLREKNPHLRWIPESRFPAAIHVARLARLRSAHGNAAETPVPIYAHPAV